MINKEFIVSSDGSIYKDFIDRNIPQNSNNQVSVNVLIPASCFTGLSNYAVLLAVSRIISGVETTLNTLVMSASKSITIDGVLYVKYSAYLTIGYTNKLGQLKVSPYIQTTTTTTNAQNESVEVVSIQQAFTNTTLNVIKSIAGQFDASLEDAEVVEIIEGQINAKKIYTFIDTESASVGEHYYNLANSYDPNASQFSGCLVLSVYGGWTNAYIPYLNNGHVELLEIIETGMFYKISDVSYADSTYTYTRTKLSYSKSEVDSIETNLQNAINQKVDKTQKVNGHALSGDITLTKGDVGLGNVKNYDVESTPTASGSNLYITSKGVYDALQLVYTAINGCATDDDLTTINNRLNSIEAIIGSDDGDADNVINTLKEVIQVLNGLGEGANLLDLINAKANQSDFNTLNSQINGENGIATKVSFLYDSNHNAYAEIKAQSGTIDILTSDWVANTGDANYPYKWELSNGYLIGVSYASVVFDKDSDTSMISTSFGIDDENGKVIIYASELPSATISIQLIAIFNSVNAYELYNQTLVSQVNANTSAISDINNTKLPQYVKLYNTQTTTINVVGADYTNHLIELGTNGVVLENIYKVSSTKKLVSNITLQNGKAKIINSTWESGSETAEHTLELDEDGNLTLDGNAVGGGKQLYQHNIQVNGKDYSSNNMEAWLTIINDSNESIDTFTKLVNYLYDNGYYDSAPFINAKWLMCTGINSYNNHFFMGIITRSAKDVLIVSTQSGDEYIASDITVKDGNIVAL